MVCSLCARPCSPNEKASNCCRILDASYRIEWMSGWDGKRRGGLWKRILPLLSRRSKASDFNQTVICILRSFLNNCLVSAYVDMRAFRRDEHGKYLKPHLPASTKEVSRSEIAQCPSRDYYTIQCPCQEGSVASSLKSKYGVNLALLPVALIQTWLREFSKMFEKQPQSRFSMTIKIAWGQAEKSPNLKQWALTDEFKQRLLVNDDWLVEAYHSSIFILTSQHQKTFSKL